MPIIPIVVKIGSQTLLRADRSLDLAQMESLVAQIIELESKGFRIVLVSSGAVACGRSIVQNQGFKLASIKDKIQERQVLSSIGQSVLIKEYNKILNQYGYYGGQVLLNREDFKSRGHYDNIHRALMGLLKADKILPIVNENDTTALSQFMFTDNDELASLVSEIVEAEKLVILTSTNGVYDRPPDEEGAQLIPHIAIEENHSCIKIGGPTQAGRGGMQSKLSSCRKAAALGIIAHITNATEHRVLLRLILEKESIGTLITGSCRVKGIKRWLSFSPAPHNIIFVNACTEERLKNTTLVSSILPLGVQKVEGDFEKGDLLSIQTMSGNLIGIGVAEYGSVFLRTVMGHPRHKCIVHYDRLWVKRFTHD